MRDSVSFKFKSRFLNKTNNSVNINVEIPAPLKYLNNFGELLKCL